MPCYYPLDGWRSTEPNENGKYPIVFKNPGKSSDLMRLPCGRCIGCRLERSRQWAMRCLHEASQHDENCFITLTYNEKHLPENESLDKRHWQQFMKKLRQQVVRDTRAANKLISKIDPDKTPLPMPRLRFFMGGEYGTDQNINTTRTIGRPHYHAILFGYEFPDTVLHSINKQGNRLYNSPSLDLLWGKGYCTIGDVTFDSAAYVARYCMKKINGPEAETHYQLINEQTGEVTNIEPEFGLQSNKPGIAHNWFLKYKKDLNKGFITLNGKKLSPPQYYGRLYDKYDEDTYAYIKDKKTAALDPFDSEYDINRLNTKLSIKLNRIKSLTRDLK